MATTVESDIGMSVASRALGARDLLKSAGLHGFVAAVVLVIPAGALRHSAEPKELDVVFHAPPPVELPLPTLPPPPPGPQFSTGLPSPHAAPRAHQALPVEPRPSAPGDPLAQGPPGPPPGPAEVPVPRETPQEKAGKSGILALSDQFANLAEDKAAPRLGADARYSAADDVGHGSSRPLLTTNAPGTSGGINVASLSRAVGGGGGGVPGGRGDMPGAPVGRATSPIASIGGGGDRPLAKAGPGPARTDEEIQIVFDRHKSSFYRLYHVELRKDPTLRGQMVLRLTIEPDGRVSMCTLQSSDMHAPDLAAEVVDRVRSINFGAKEGVQALTIVYPIDFLPAA